MDRFELVLRTASVFIIFTFVYKKQTTLDHMNYNEMIKKKKEGNHEKGKGSQKKNK